MTNVQLHLGDCLEVLPTLEPQSIDAIITDLPYGTTACKWDSVIPFAPMWAAVKHVLKPRGAFVTTASQPFTSALVMSNPGWFRYAWVWDKDFSGNFQLARKMPLRRHEDIAIFSAIGPMYNPQMIERDAPLDTSRWTSSKKGDMGHFGSRAASHPIYDRRFPGSILRFCSVAGECNNTRRIHPTQKPVALYEYLIRTYTNPGNTVLDMTMGSGTTGVAAVNTGRRFVGIEKDAGYFAIAQRRIAEAQMQPLLFATEPTQKEEVT